MTQLFLFIIGCAVVSCSLELSGVSSSNATRYELNYDRFLRKHQQPLIRTKRHLRMFVDTIMIDNIEMKINWENFLTGKRLGSGFTLKKNRQFVENALLYAPKDESFTVRGLLDASSYLGEVKIIRDKVKSKRNTTQGDTIKFKINSPRIISASEKKEVLLALSKLSQYVITIESVSVAFKLPVYEAENLFLEVSSVTLNKTSPRAVVRVVKSSSTAVVNDLPAHSVVRIALKTLNMTASPVEHVSAYLFTGSIMSFTNFTAKPATLAIQRKTSSRNDIKQERVTCHVKNKQSFTGFPCRGTQMCLPLSWTCDGEKDCPDGYDELDCSNHLTTHSSTHVYQNVNSSCGSDEFQCMTDKGLVCLPLKGLCDGKAECTNGWDEDKRNCKHNYYPVRPGVDEVDDWRCKRNYFRCRRGGCIPKRYVCDGYRDCKDGSDELRCSDDEDFCDPLHEYSCFRSVGNNCIPMSWVCDDQNDCPRGEDEMDETCYQYFA